MALQAVGIPFFGFCKLVPDENAKKSFIRRVYEAKEIRIYFFHSNTTSKVIKYKSKA